MLACDLWLRVDFLARHGHTITTRPDGTRVAQGRQSIPLPPHCGHPECPDPAEGGPPSDLRKHANSHGKGPGASEGAVSPNPVRPDVRDATRCAEEAA